MNEPASFRMRAAAIVVAAGLVGTGVLVATQLNTVPNQNSAPHAIVELPEFSGSKQIMGGSFYDTPKIKIGEQAPGSLIRSERIADAPPGITAYRLMYTSQTAAGVDNAVTAVYAVRSGPPPTPNGRPIVAVAHGTTGIAPGCGISQAPFTPGSTGFGTWEQIMSGLVGAGFAVVATDYANLGPTATPDYLVQDGEAHDVLNSVRAVKKLDPATVDGSNIGIIGHSQGGHSALSAAYDSDAYAPDVAIKGTVALAPAIFPPAPVLIKFLETGRDKPDAAFMAFISDVVNSWVANYPDEFQMDQLYTEKGIAAAQVALTGCLSASAEAFDAPKKEFMPPTLPNSILGIAAKNFPIWDKYPVPILIQQGLKDTTVVPGINLAAARTFCRQGSTVALQTYPEDVHSSLLYTGAPEAISWLQDRFADKPAPSDCGGL
ncbi:MAG: alpha/beta fold hydrolase [Candidatus Nanopelagicales bacterium]|nr:alpha/beta fold hydrolase [Candidatus Nanopelagicales bacterium]MDZ4250664.1 alpha/beta fold hydrolase [Candidatus Nanopelagicales bacterium]